MKKLIILLLLPLLSLFFLIPTPAYAEQSGLQISPLTFNFGIEKGGQATGKIIVTNLNNQAIDYQIEAEDFAQVSDDGAPSFGRVAESEGLSTLSSWIVFSEEVTGQLAAKDSIDVNFVINVPKDAEPGGYYAAVFARQVVKTAEGSTELGVSPRVGTLILVSVPGIVSNEAEITEFNPPSFLWRGPVDFSMKVSNTGSVHYDSQGKIIIDPIIGTTDEVDLGTHTIIPNNTRNYTGTWNKRFPFGYYTVTAQATNGLGEWVTTKKVVWALPLEIAIPALLLLIIIILLIKKLRRKYKIVPNN
jgi:hypothetical protein